MLARAGSPISAAISAKPGGVSFMAVIVPPAPARGTGQHYDRDRSVAAATKDTVEGVNGKNGGARRLPGADAPGVDVDEIGVRVIAHPAGAKRDGGGADVVEALAGH